MVSERARASTSTRPSRPSTANFRMACYILAELPALIAAHVPADMGAARDHRPFDGRPWRADSRAAQSRPLPQRLRLRADRGAVAGAVGREGVGGLSRHRSAPWRGHDAVAFIQDRARLDSLLVDQGEADSFLAEQSGPNCSKRPVLTRESRSSCAAGPATITAIISSRPSWKTICVGMRSTSERRCSKNIKSCI